MKNEWTDQRGNVIGAKSMKQRVDTLKDYMQFSTDMLS